jgi:hypothetical protein
MSVQASTFEVPACACLQYPVCCLLLPLRCQDPDYEREKRWSDQIVPSILVGDVVWIKQKSGP